MPKKLRRLDADSRRRRAEVIAEITDARPLRDGAAPRRARLARLREIVDHRRRTS